MPDDSDQYVRGSALVGLALAQSLMSLLREKRILSDEETDGVLEAVLSGLEIKLPDEPAVRQARVIVEEIGRAVLKAKRNNPQ